MQAHRVLHAQVISLTASLHFLLELVSMHTLDVAAGLQKMIQCHSHCITEYDKPLGAPKGRAMYNAGVY